MRRPEGPLPSREMADLHQSDPAQAMRWSTAAFVPEHLRGDPRCRCVRVQPQSLGVSGGHVTVPRSDQPLDASQPRCTESNRMQERRRLSAQASVCASAAQAPTPNSGPLRIRVRPSAPRTLPSACPAAAAPQPLSRLALRGRGRRRGTPHSLEAVRPAHHPGRCPGQARQGQGLRCDAGRGCSSSHGAADSHGRHGRCEAHGAQAHAPAAACSRTAPVCGGDAPRPKRAPAGKRGCVERLAESEHGWRRHAAHLQHKSPATGCLIASPIYIYIYI